MIRWTMLALTPLMLAAQDAPTSRDYGESGNWEIVEYPNACYASVSFKSGTNLHFRFDAARKLGTVSMFGDAFSWVAAKSRTPVLLVFVKDEKVYDNLGTVSAVGIVTASGRKGISIDMEGETLINDFARADTVGILRDDKVVASLSLDGSPDAARLLRECAAQVPEIRGDRMAK